MMTLKVEPMMRAHYPGWSITTGGKDGDARSYMLWAPRAGDRWNERDRPNWAACWTRRRGYDGNFLHGDSAEQVLAVFPNDEEAQQARRLLLEAANVPRTEERW